MARNRDSMDFLLSCQVCFEDFEEEGDHVPRLLPCTHTVCESCIKQLMKNNKLECPECRTEHGATNGEKSFPQNKYLLAQIRKKKNVKDEEDQDKERCEEHGKELILFCLEDTCQKPICIFCLTAYHKKHDVTDLEKQKEKEKEILTGVVTKIIQYVEAKADLVSVLKKDAVEKADRCLAELEKRKHELVKQIDRMIQEVENQKKKISDDAENGLLNLRQNLELYGNIQENISSTHSSYDAIKTYRDMVRGIIESQKKNLSDVEHFLVPVFSKDKLPAEEMIGHITQEEHTMLMPSYEDVSAKGTKNEMLPTILTTKVTLTINTGISVPNSITVLGGSTGVICGDEEGTTRIKSYDLHTGAELCCVDLSEDAFGLAEVKLGKKLALAVSYSSEEKIEFRDATDLRKTIQSLSFAPHQPGKICSVMPNTLLYVDWSKSPRQIHWLNLNESQPKPAAGKTVDVLRDMCVVQNGDKQLLVVSCGRDGIFAYNIMTDELEWKVDGKPSGMDESIDASNITTDGRGHLFVSDWVKGNRCIQVFEVSNGKHLGCILKDVKTFGDSGNIEWSPALACLLSVCWWKEKTYLNVIEIESRS